MKKLLIPIFLILALAMPMAVMGTGSLTTPAANVDQKQGATFLFTATTDATTDWMAIVYARRGDSSNTTLFNETLVNYTIADAVWSNSSTLPVTFGNYQFCVLFNTSAETDCNANIQLKNYEAAEVSEATIDTVVVVIGFVAAFATLIGLVLLYNWARKKTFKF